MPPPDPGAQSPAERDFIELATRPLETAPNVRDEARGELMERLSRQPPHHREAAAEVAVSRLAKTVPGRWRGKALAAAVAGLVLTGLLIYLGFSFFRGIEAASEEWSRAAHYHLEPPPEIDPATIDPAGYEEATRRLNTRWTHW